MANDLPNEGQLISIGKAAKLLGVSVDTARRWDKTGKLHSVRTRTNKRYFKMSEIELITNSKQLSISEAAKVMGVSPTTLRRLERKGEIKPKRNTRGERIYTQSTIDDYNKQKEQSKKTSKRSKDSLVQIGEAALILGVSRDTIRRWDKKGKLQSTRPDGSTRYFEVAELEALKASKPLTIGEAGQKLGISPTTLRRLERRGLISPFRNSRGERIYTQEVLDNYTHSKAKTLTRSPKVERKVPLITHKDTDVAPKAMPASVSLDIKVEQIIPPPVVPNSHHTDNEEEETV